jgi:hypothetical protein
MNRIKGIGFAKPGKYLSLSTNQSSSVFTPALAPGASVCGYKEF